MRMELLIDTSTKYASIGLSKNGILQHSFQWCAMFNHSVETIPNINKDIIFFITISRILFNI